MNLSKKYLGGGFTKSNEGDNKDISSIIQMVQSLESLGKEVLEKLSYDGKVEEILSN